MSKILFLGCIAVFVFSVFSANAEIEKLTIKWTAGLCKESCIKGLDKQFRLVPGVAEINMNQPGGQVDLRYKPNAGYSFVPINTAMSMIGLSINDIRIKVRGMVRSVGRKIVLISQGDNTRFELLSPVQPNPTQYVQEFSPYSHPLTPERRDALLEAERHNNLVVIEGPIFEPERSPPNQIIIERLTVETPNENPS